MAFDSPADLAKDDGLPAVAESPRSAAGAALQVQAIRSLYVNAYSRLNGRSAVARKTKQGGGTVLGVLIGIVVGLAIAVVTALLVTKTTLPFSGPAARSTDKATQTPAAAPPTGTAPEAPKPQVPVAPGDTPDPNRTAAARQRAAPGQPPIERREIATVNATTPAVAPPATSQGPSPGTGGVGTGVPPVGSGAPGGTSRPPNVLSTVTGASMGEGQAPIRAAVPSVPSAAGAVPGAAPGAVPAQQAALTGGERGATYLLQAGAFRGPEDADAMKLRLALMGLEAQIVTADVSGTTLYRVRVGPYAGLDSMNKARARLAENGVEATVLRQR